MIRNEFSFLPWIEDINKYKFLQVASTVCYNAMSRQKQLFKIQYDLKEKEEKYITNKENYSFIIKINNKKINLKNYSYHKFYNYLSDREAFRNNLKKMFNYINSKNLNKFDVVFLKPVKNQLNTFMTYYDFDYADIKFLCQSGHLFGYRNAILIRFNFYFGFYNQEKELNAI